jgi:hypothetical protein
MSARPPHPTTTSRRIALWRRLLERLAEWNPDWRARTGIDAPRANERAAADLAEVSNAQAFEAFAVALLSGNTRWDRIERVRDALGEPFDRFDPRAFAARSDRSLDQEVMPWFRAHRAGAAGLRASLGRLRQTAAILAGDNACGSAGAFHAAAVKQAGGSPEGLAMLLGNAREWKLPGFGIALAAEALRLLGLDLCKPDRHVLRAIGSWNLVDLARWDEKGAYTAPQARPAELLATMLAVRTLAEANDLGVSRANSVIWTAGAVSGARLTNAEFRAMIDGL